MSEFPGLTPPESKDYKELKAKRDAGLATPPEELKRYKDLKAKIKNAEADLNALKTPPQKREDPRDNNSAISRQKSIIKTPDNQSSMKPRR